MRGVIEKRIGTYCYKGVGNEGSTNDRDCASVKSRDKKMTPGLDSAEIRLSRKSKGSCLCFI